MVEESINVGTEDEAETPKDTPQEFVATSFTLDKTSFMKQIRVTLIYIADALEKEAESHKKMKKLAEERLSKIQSLESQLGREKDVSIQLQQNLNKADEELQQLRKEKEMNDRSCFEAFKKVEEFRLMHDKSQEKVIALEKEISQLTATRVNMDIQKHSLSELMKEKEQQFYSSEGTVEKQAAELNALKVEIAALKKVIV